MLGFSIYPLLAIKVSWIIFIVVMVLLIAGMIALAIYGKKLQARQEESKAQMEAAKQVMKMLVIDKKRMKMKDAGLPQFLIDQTPKRFRGQKLPIVKAKIGPKVMSLICEEAIFDLIPVKKEVRAEISGIYILNVKGIHASLDPKKRKLTFSEKIKKKASELGKKQ
ncbi:MAG: hypothetical protein K6D02_03165 [Lachnospiraceae bacterium]|nr:hypothetical protein [Lachnospiraceae bacterium]